MDGAEYENIYLELIRKLQELKDRRAELETTLGDTTIEIETLESALNHLAPLAGFAWNDNVAGLGITDATRKILELDRNAWMSAADIKMKMTEQGFDFSKYSAPDASIHKILKRLVEAKKAEVRKEDWKVFYKFLMTDADIPF